mgnify:FL=1
MAGFMTLLSLCLLVAAAVAYPRYHHDGTMDIGNRDAHVPSDRVEKTLSDLQKDLMNNQVETDGGRLIPDVTRDGDFDRAPAPAPAATRAPEPAPQPSGGDNNRRGGNSRCGNGQGNSGRNNGNRNDGDCNGNFNSGDDNG